MVTGNGDLTINADPPPAPAPAPGGSGGGRGVAAALAAPLGTGLGYPTTDGSTPSTRQAGSPAAAQLAASALPANRPLGRSDLAAIDTLFATGSGISGGGSPGDLLFLDPLSRDALGGDQGLTGW
jgi:hypothetical protein